MERKKIVILDGFAANPGDLSWGEIEARGDCSVYVRCDSELEIVERASDAEIILTNKSVISRRVMGTSATMRGSSRSKMVALAYITQPGSPSTGVPSAK